MKKHDQEFDREKLSAMMDGEWQADDVRGALVDVCRDEALRARWSRYHLARDAMHAEALDVRGSVAARVSAAIADEPAYSNVTAIGTGPGLALAGRAGTDADTGAGTGGGQGGGQGGESRAAARGTTPRTFAAGFGLAASVALVTVVGLNAWQGGDGAPTAPGASVAAGAEAIGTGAIGTGAAVVAAADESAAPAADPFSRQLPGAPLPQVELVANTGAFWSAPDSSARRTESEERLNMFLSRHIESSPTAERQGMLPYSRLVGYDERAPEAR